MYELISNLILYGNLPEDEILVQLAKLLSDDEKSNHELRQEIYGQIKRLLELATQYGFNDNLWHNYLTYLLMTNMGGRGEELARYQEFSTPPGQRARVLLADGTEVWLNANSTLIVFQHLLIIKLYLNQN